MFYEIIFLSTTFFILLLIFNIIINYFFCLTTQFTFLVLYFFVSPSILYLVSLFFSPMDYIHESFFSYLLIASCYIQSYPALKYDIPSFKIILTIYENSNKNGYCSYSKILKSFNDDELYFDKFSELINDGFLTADKKLTTKGYFLVNFFIFYRYIFKYQTRKG